MLEKLSSSPLSPGQGVVRFSQIIFFFFCLFLPRLFPKILRFPCFPGVSQLWFSAELVCLHLVTRLAEFRDEILSLIDTEANKAICSSGLELRPGRFVAGLGWGQTPPALALGHEGFEAARDAAPALPGGVRWGSTNLFPLKASLPWEGVGHGGCCIRRGSN